MKIYLSILGLVLFYKGLADARCMKWCTECGRQVGCKQECPLKSNHCLRVPGAVKETSSMNLQGSDPIKAVAIGNAEFGLKLYEKLSEERMGEGGGGNLVTSPYSVGMAMAMLQAGARGQTREQIMKGMHFPNNGTLLEGYRKAIRLAKIRTNFTMEIANKLFVKDGVELTPYFQTILDRYFDASVAQTDFSEKGGEISRKFINNWVEKQTREKIKDLIPEGVLDVLTRLVLVNTVYFKGDWASKFECARDDDFFVYEGKTVSVPMMRIQRGKFKIKYFEDLNSKAIELPYSGDTVSMYIILPVERFGIQELAIKLLQMNILELLSKIDDRPAARVDVVALPKFKMETTIELPKILQKLGITKMFSRIAADFSGITESESENLYVSEVITKTFIEVNEEGTEAAGATAGIVPIFIKNVVGIRGFICDHPFYFFIKDKMTNMVLFQGLYLDPIVV